MSITEKHIRLKKDNLSRPTSLLLRRLLPAWLLRAVARPWPSSWDLRTSGRSPVVASRSSPRRLASLRCCLPRHLWLSIGSKQVIGRAKASPTLVTSTRHFLYNYICLLCIYISLYNYLYLYATVTVLLTIFHIRGARAYCPDAERSAPPIVVATAHRGRAVNLRVACALAV